MSSEQTDREQSDTFSNKTIAPENYRPPHPRDTEKRRVANGWTGKEPRNDLKYWVCNHVACTKVRQDDETLAYTIPEHCGERMTASEELQKKIHVCLDCDFKISDRRLSQRISQGSKAYCPDCRMRMYRPKYRTLEDFVEIRNT